MKELGKIISGARGLLVFLLLLLSAPGRADEIDAGFDAANKLYEQGKYSEAASAYEKLLQSGRASGAIFFNLGNSYLKSGQTGRAIAAYRSAGRLDPRDPDLGANLDFARKQVQGPTDSTGKWDHFLKKLSLDEWTLSAIAILWIWLGLLCLIQIRPGLKSFLRGYIIGFAVAIVGIGACCAAAVCEARLEKTAIVITRDSPVHNGPLEESQKAFVTHDGAELRILDHKDDWLQVSAGQGRIGWVRRDQVVVTPGA